MFRSTVMFATVTFFLAVFTAHAAPLSQVDAVLVLDSPEQAARMLTVTGGRVECAGDKSVGVWVIRAQKDIHLQGFTVVGCTTGVVVEESACPGLVQRDGTEPSVYVTLRSH